MLSVMEVKSLDCSESQYGIERHTTRLCGCSGPCRPCAHVMQAIGRRASQPTRGVAVTSRQHSYCRGHGIITTAWGCQSRQRPACRQAQLLWCIRHGLLQHKLLGSVDLRIALYIVTPLGMQASNKSVPTHRVPPAGARADSPSPSAVSPPLPAAFLLERLLLPAPSKENGGRP